ncbi:MAG: metallopeptidase family protein [Polyangiales bacterium]
MLRPRPGRPFSVTLPSGATTTLTVVLRPQRPDDLLQALRDGAVTSTLPLLDAPLADANVVEAIATALGAIASPPAELTCRNCHADIEVDGAPHLPLTPLLSPQGDPELDPPVDLPSEHALPRPFHVGRKARVAAFRLARRTLRDREQLVSALGAAAGDPDAPLPLTAAFVRALGLSLVGEKRAREDPPLVESPTAIARALTRLDDTTFDVTWCAIARAWDEQHYSPRLLAPVPCPECGARHDVEVPARRPIAVYAPPRDDERPGEPRAFPELAAFRARAQVLARELIDATGLSDDAGLEVVVDDDVPPCDDGGEPLLGSYTPFDDASVGGDTPRPSTSPFVIALYYRTFRAMFDDEPYDVDAEIRETLEHELEHHLGHLAGDDPLDDDEREEIERERTRVQGARTPAASLVEGAGWLAGDVGRFFRTTWPLWLLALIALVVVIGSAR